MNHKMKAYASLMGSNPVEQPPAPTIQSVGYMMREWLENIIVDSGTAVDIGMGMGEVDMWATIDGKEYIITIKEK